MLEEALAGLLELVFGNVEGVSVAVTLFLAAHYLGKATMLGFLLQNLRVTASLLALLLVGGVIDIHPGVAIGLLEAGLNLVSGLLGGVLP